jgi:hypothetical protein
MKTMRFVVSAACMWGLLASCSSEVDLFPEDAPKMLYVLGCIDGSGTTHQVKIRKVVQGEGDATAMINDPAWYLPDKSMRVWLEDSYGGVWPLERVLYPAQTGGVVSQDSNYIYEIRGYRPDRGDSLMLRIDDPADGFSPSSGVRVMGPYEFTYPVKESVVKGVFNFTDSLRPFHVQYLVGAINSLSISIKYVDVRYNGDRIYRKATFSGAEGTSGYFGHEYPLTYLWNIFKKIIPDDPEVDFRLFYRFDFTHWCGDSHLSKYIVTAQKFKDNRRLSAGNINNGLGLFFSVSHAKLENVCPKVSFWPALALSEAVSRLKFSKVVYDGPYTDPDSVDMNPFLSFTK